MLPSRSGQRWTADDATLPLGVWLGRRWHLPPRTLERKGTRGRGLHTSRCARRSSTFVVEMPRIFFVIPALSVRHCSR